jgi:DNA-3-methyladenine glycosylase II
MSTHTPFSESISTATAYLARVDPVMASAIALVGPCTLLPDPDIFEALVDAIISQQISVKAADAIMGRIRSALPGGLVTPSALVPFDYEQLRTLGLSSQKARYIRNLLDHIASGELDLAQLPQIDDEAVISKLIEVKGIGRWTAEMILIFSLARLDVLPVDDLGFVEGVREAYALPTRPTRKEMLERGELWRPYRTIATWYMWAFRRHSQQNKRERTRIVSL